LFCRSANRPQNNTTRLRTKREKKQNTLYSKALPIILVSHKQETKKHAPRTVDAPRRERVDGSFRGARWAWTWKPEGSRFPSSLAGGWSQLRPCLGGGEKGGGETLFQRGLGVCICGAAAYRVLVQWCCVGPCLFGPGRVGLGTMLA
jgi:hypothetical protein